MSKFNSYSLNQEPLIWRYLSYMQAGGLKQLARGIPDCGEASVTDRYDGLVAASHHTSDYYQVDEAWCLAAFRSDRGSLPGFCRFCRVGCHLALRWLRLEAALYEPYGGIN